METDKLDLGVVVPTPTKLLVASTITVLVSMVKPAVKVTAPVTAKVPAILVLPLAKTLNKEVPVVEAISSNLTVGAVAADVEIDKFDL